MKKLVYLSFLILFMSACSSEKDEDSSKKGTSKESTEEQEDQTLTPEVTARIPTELEGDIVPCDCYRTIIGLMDRAIEEDVSEELAGANARCAELAEEIGQEDFELEMELCARVDTLKVDITGLTSCDCKTQIIEFMERATEMESNQALADEFKLIQDKCAVLEAQMSSKKYKEGLDACN